MVSPKSSRHTGNVRDDYYTPKHVFDTLGLQFDIDVAAPTGGVPWIPATRYYTKEDDGLLQEWSGIVWMNPPFSNPIPWMTRFLEHANGVCILPLSESRWARDAWSRLDGIAYVTPRIKYVTPAGTSSTVFMPTLIGAMGTTSVAALHGFGRVR